MKQSNPNERKKQNNKAKNNCLVQANGDPNYLKNMRADQIANFVPRLIRELLQNKINLDKSAVLLYHAGFNVLGNGTVTPSYFQQTLLDTLLAYSMAAQNRANAFIFYKNNYIMPNLQINNGQVTDKTRHLIDADINYETINAKIYYDMYTGFVNMYRTGNYSYLLPVIAGNQNYQYDVYQPNNDPIQYLTRELRNARGGDNRRDNNRRGNNNDKRSFKQNNNFSRRDKGSLHSSRGQHSIFPSGKVEPGNSME